jgi:hypothetical protein
MHKQQNSPPCWPQTIACQSHTKTHNSHNTQHYYANMQSKNITYYKIIIFIAVFSLLQINTYFCSNYFSEQNSFLRGGSKPFQRLFSVCKWCKWSWNHYSTFHFVSTCHRNISKIYAANYKFLGIELQLCPVQLSPFWRPHPAPPSTSVSCRFISYYYCYYTLVIAINQNRQCMTNIFFSLDYMIALCI